MPSPLHTALRLPLALGDRALRVWRYLACVVAVMAGVIRIAAQRRYWVRTVRQEFIEQCHVIAVGAVPFVLTLALLVGTAIVAQTFVWLSFAGQSDLLGRSLVLGLVRETAPLTVALVVMGRSGTAIIADLGTMMATGQVRALDAQGIDPFIFLAVPRVLAVTVAIIGLTLIFICTALVSGYVIAFATHLTNITAGMYAFLIFKAIGPLEGLGLLLKTLLPGLVMGAVCCDRGLSVSHSVTEIPHMIMSGFARGVTAMALINTTVSVLVYF